MIADRRRDGSWRGMRLCGAVPYCWQGFPLWFQGMRWCLGVLPRQKQRLPKECGALLGKQQQLVVRVHPQLWHRVLFFLSMRCNVCPNAGSLRRWCEKPQNVAGSSGIPKRRQSSTFSNTEWLVENIL